MTNDVKAPRFEVEFWGGKKMPGDDLRKIIADLIEGPDFAYPSGMNPVSIVEVGSAEYRSKSGPLHIVLGGQSGLGPVFVSGNVEMVFRQAQIDCVIDAVVAKANATLDGESGPRSQFDGHVDECVQLARRFLPDYDYLYDCFELSHAESWVRLEKFVDRLNVLRDKSADGYELPLPRKFTWPNGVVLFDADRFRYNRMTRDICRALGDDQKVENLRAQRENFLQECLKYPGSQPGGRKAAASDAGLSPS